MTYLFFKINYWISVIGLVLNFLIFIRTGVLMFIFPIVMFLMGAFSCGHMMDILEPEDKDNG